MARTPPSSCPEGHHVWDTVPAHTFTWPDGTRIAMPAITDCQRCDTHTLGPGGPATPTAAELELWFLLTGPERGKR